METSRKERHPPVAAVGAESKAAPDARPAGAFAAPLAAAEKRPPEPSPYSGYDRNGPVRPPQAPERAPLLRAPRARASVCSACEVGGLGNACPWSVPRTGIAVPLRMSSREPTCGLKPGHVVGHLQGRAAG